MGVALCGRGCLFTPPLTHFGLFDWKMEGDTVILQVDNDSTCTVHVFGTFPVIREMFSKYISDEAVHVWHILRVIDTDDTPAPTRRHQ